MVFNFKTFSAFATKAYKELGESPYILDEVLAVFKCYFTKYEREMCEPHPNLRLSQIKHIISVMPYLEKDFKSGAPEDIDADCYPDMINQHFKTEYRGNCDYNINHFFSGCIRELRYYETLY